MPFENVLSTISKYIEINQNLSINHWINRSTLKKTDRWKWRRRRKREWAHMTFGLRWRLRLRDIQFISFDIPPKQRTTTGSFRRAKKRRKWRRRCSRINTIIHSCCLFDCCFTKPNFSEFHKSQQLWIETNLNNLHQNLHRNKTENDWSGRFTDLFDLASSHDNFEYAHLISSHDIHSDISVFLPAWIVFAPEQNYSFWAAVLLRFKNAWMQLLPLPTHG